jgi:lysozyme
MKNFLLLIFLLSTNGKVTYSKSLPEARNFFVIEDIREECEKLTIIKKPLLTEKAFEFIKFWEGFRERPYKCAAGSWTVGYGTLVKGNPNLKTVSRPQAKALAIDHIKKLIKRIPTIVDVKITEDQLISLTSFSYNLGFYSLKRSTLLKAINSCNDSLIKKEFVRWNKVRPYKSIKKVVLKGLTKRRKAELNLWVKNSK